MTLPCAYCHGARLVGWSGAGPTLCPDCSRDQDAFTVITRAWREQRSENCLLRELNEHATRERERMAGEIERLAANGRTVVDLLRRIVKYAREDRMRTERSTRLARAVSEAAKLIEGEP